MQKTSQFENEVTLGATGMAAQGGQAERTPPRAEEDGFMEDLEEDPTEEDRCAPGGKKTQPKKTTFSNRLNYRTFRPPLTDVDLLSTIRVWNDNRIAGEMLLGGPVHQHLAH